MPHPLIDRIIRALFGNSHRQLFLFPDAIDALVPEDGCITFDLVRAVAQLFGRQAAGALCPEVLSRFVRSVLQDNSSTSILDPWAGVGSLIIPIAESIGSLSIVQAVEPNVGYSDLGHDLSSHIGARWATCSPLEWLERANQSFDLIVCNPPFGLRTEPMMIAHGHENARIRDYLRNLVLLHACLRMADSGQCIFIVPPSFISRHRANSVFNSLDEFDLRLDAYIYIQPGAFAPITMMPAALVVIRRGRSTDVFVGELTKNEERNELLAENLRNRREASTLGFGALVASSAFRGYQPLVADLRVQSLSRRLRLPAIRMGDIAAQVNRLHPQRDEQFEDIPNSVFLPLIGCKRVSASIAELSTAPHHCVQIVLDPEKALADYVARFLNTPLGEAVREQVAIEGSVQHQISRRSVEEIVVYLPLVAQQLATLETQTTISNLASELSDLQHQLWNQPHTLNDVAVRVTNVNREDRFTDWLDTLPFPLATILWTYHASGTNHHRRYEHLLRLFEGLAQFFATVLLSGFSNERVGWSDKLRSIKACLDRDHLSMERGTFGTWVTIIETLSKSARSLANRSEEDKLLCQQMFRTSDQRVLNLLFSKKVIHLLQEANAARNRWMGHGGIVSDEEAHHRHISLSSLLGQLRAVFGQDWERSDLILPKTSRFVDGSFIYVAERLVGTRTPFETVNISTSEPLDDGSLYLHTPGTSTALRLLPLVKVMPSPRTALNACYFYNRRESEGIRFVSYHFEQESEIMANFEDTSVVLDLFSGDT